jgi:uncharacterized protein YciI
MVIMNQYLYTLQVTRLGMLHHPTAEEQSIAAHHIAYMQKLVAEGIGIFGGALSVRDSRHMGLFIFQAEDETQARQIIDNDPGVQSRIFRGCLFPYRIALWNAAAVQLAAGQQHYFYLIQAVRPAMVKDSTVWEDQVVSDHFMYLKAQTEKDIFCLVGRTQNDDYSTMGIGVLRADSEAQAWQIAEQDPAVIQRVMRLDVLPFGIATVKTELATA